MRTPWLRTLLAVMLSLPVCLMGEWKSTSFEGFPVLSQLPDDPVGLVLLLHGSGGSVEFANKPATVTVLRFLLDHGYGFFATSSTQRTQPKRWNPHVLDLGASADLARLERLYLMIVHESELPERLPLFVMGMSNGANMATTVGYSFEKAGYPVKAVAAYMGGFSKVLTGTGDYAIPTFMVIAENEGVVSNDKLRRVHRALEELAVPVELVEAFEAPLTIDVLGDYGVAEPQATFRELVRQGVVDSDGRRTAEIVGLTPENPGVLALEFIGSDLARVRDALMAAWAMHKMRGDFADRQLAFFERFRER